jgi:hypothetical protein
MKFKTSYFLMIALATLSQTATGVTVISQTGFPTYGWAASGDEYKTVAWSQASSYTGMNISALLWSPDPTDHGTAWLTTRIGPGTTVADQVATTTFAFPSSIGPWTVPSLVLFSGLTLDAGAYYLTIGGGATRYSSWPGANPATFTADTGVTLDGNLWSTPGAAQYPPASGFSLGSGWSSSSASQAP